MANNRTQELLHELGMSFTVENAHIVRQAVGETILAILATDLRDRTYTTFDEDRMNYAVGRVVDQVRKHWNFDENH